MGWKRAFAGVAVVVSLAAGGIVSATPAAAAVGVLDPTFGTGGVADATYVGSGGDSMLDAVVTPDGGSVMLAKSIGPNDTVVQAIRRVDATGALVATFATDRAQDLRAPLAVDASGAVYVAASPPAPNDLEIDRYTPAGDLDPAFGVAGRAIFYVPLSLPSPVALVVGQFGVTVVGVSGAVRLTSNGQLDATFGGAGSVTYSTPGFSGFRATKAWVDKAGQITVSGSIGDFPDRHLLVLRLAHDGTPAVSFGGGDGMVSLDLGENGSAGGLAVRADGSIAVAVRDDGVPTLLGLTSDGSVDGGFGTGGALEITGLPTQLLDDKQGGLLFEAPVQSGTTFPIAIMRVGRHGTFDHDFGVGGSVAVPATGTLRLTPPDLFMTITNYRGNVLLSRWLATGQVDVSYGTDGTATFDIPGVALILPVAWAYLADGTSLRLGAVYIDDRFRGLVQAFRPDGTLSPSFGQGGAVDIGGGQMMYPEGIAADGTALFVAGWDDLGAGTIQRRLSDGSLDPGFASGGQWSDPRRWNAIAVDRRHRPIAVTGGPFSASVLRLDPAGVPDPSFGVNGYADVPGMSELIEVATASNGKIVVSDFNGRVGRLSADGTLDPTFGTGGVSSAPVGVTAGAYRIVVDRQDRVLVAGKNGVMRLTSGGVADTSFSGDGFVSEALDNVGTIPYTGPSVALLPDGTVIAGATDLAPGKCVLFAVDDNGQPAIDFGPGGAATYGDSTCQPGGFGVDPRGRIDLAYDHRAFEDVAYYVARLVGDGASSVKVGDVTVTEGDSGTSDATFTIHVSPPPDTDLALAVHTTDGKAKAGPDYVALDTTVIVPAGQSSVDVPVAVVGDTTRERTEAFTLSVAPAPNLDVARGTGRGTILDNEGTSRLR
jgi:uncharacterized delta-60 repeat protein